MKLILGYNQRQPFVDYYDDLAKRSGGNVEYANYAGLLFIFDPLAEQPLQLLHTATGRFIADYDGVYLNNYLPVYEQAAAAALACLALGVAFVNRELGNAPSLSKLTSYVKLTAAGVALPRTLAGSPEALRAADENLLTGLFPAVLKRADADRGIDNFKVQDRAQVIELLQDQGDKSVWILQRYVPNDGFYVVACYDGRANFAIYRTLEERPDGNRLLAHMYKPRGGANAELLELDAIPAVVTDVSRQAMAALDRQIGSVDCLYDQQTQQVYVLEVNYNPQLVTIETFKDRRRQAFLVNLQQPW